MRSVNLLPPDSGRSHALPSPTILAAAAAPVVAAGLVFGGYALEHSAAVNKRSKLAALNAEIRALPPSHHTSAAQSLLADEASTRLSTLNSVLAYRMPWDTMLRHLGELLPSGTWLTSLTLTSPSTPGTQNSTANGFSATGYASSQDAVAHVLQRLALLPGLENLALSSSSASTVGSTSFVQFQITGQLQPATPTPAGPASTTASSSGAPAQASPSTSGGSST